MRAIRRLFCKPCQRRHRHIGNQHISNVRLPRDFYPEMQAGWFRGPSPLTFQVAGRMFFLSVEQEERCEGVTVVIEEDLGQYRKGPL